MRRLLTRLALVPAGALAVHQLRYMLAFGRRADALLARQGHAYLHSLVPWLVMLIGVAVGGFLWALGRAMAGQRSLPRYTLSLAVLWLVCSACLVGIFVAQELLEGMFAVGHPIGVLGVFGFGGWWSIPAALCVGLVLAVAFHGACWVLDEVAQRYARGAPRRRDRDARLRRPCRSIVPALSPLADGCSGRGPPS